jgi:hypothetical protein
VSALHHEVLAAVGVSGHPVSTWFVVGYVNAEGNPGRWRRVAGVLGDLRRRGLIRSRLDDRPRVSSAKRGHLWSIP